MYVGRHTAFESFRAGGGVETGVMLGPIEVT